MYITDSLNSVQSKVFCTIFIFLYSNIVQTNDTLSRTNMFHIKFRQAIKQNPYDIILSKVIGLNWFDIHQPINQFEINVL